MPENSQNIQLKEKDGQIKSKNIKLKKVVFFSEEDKYAVFIGHDNNRYVGNIQHNPEHLINIELEINYEEKIHPKYGHYFHIHNYQSNISDLEYFLKYVIKGFSKKSIEEILKKYDEETLLKVLENKPKELLSISGIGKKKLELITERFPKYKKLFELSKFLGKLGVSFSLIEKIYEHFGEDSIKKIQENPYELTQIDGIGFLKADEIALKIGIDYNSPLRISAAIVYVYNNFVKSHGDTVVLFDALLKETIGFLSKYHTINKENIIQTIESHEDFEVFIICEEDKKISRKYISAKNYIYKENYIIKKLTDKDSFFNLPLSDRDLNLLKTELIYNMRIKLSDKQNQAFDKFLSSASSVFLLAGYAGTGKTTFSKLIMDAFGRIYGKDKVVGCALSGMAANRIKQKTGYPSFTIHSLLKYSNGQFYFCEKRKLTQYKLIVIDEASMIDIDLFYSLIQAIDLTQTKLLIIGDPAQLPPIGAGDVFNDLLSYTSIPKVVLDEIFRQNSEQAINLIAQDIRKGTFPDIYGNYKDFVFYEEKDNQKILDKLVLNYKEEYQDLIKDKKPTVEDWLFGIQVLTPIKATIIGVENLNFALKNMLNPANKNTVNVKINDKKIISLRDKVIHLKNEAKIIHENISSIASTQRIDAYKESLLFNEEDIPYLAKIKVLNGQVGIVSNIFQIETDIYIEVFYPNENYYVLYSTEDFKERTVDLGYAISIHKSQGSEYRKVLMPFSKSFYVMLNTKLLYTAITRAKNKMLIIGDSDAVRIAINKKGTNTILTNIKIQNTTYYGF